MPAVRMVTFGMIISVSFSQGAPVPAQTRVDQASTKGASFIFKIVHQESDCRVLETLHTQDVFASNALGICYSQTLAGEHAETPPSRGSGPHARQRSRAAILRSRTAGRGAEREPEEGTAPRRPCPFPTGLYHRTPVDWDRRKTGLRAHHVLDPRGPAVLYPVGAGSGSSEQGDA